MLESHRKKCNFKLIQTYRVNAGTILASFQYGSKDHICITAYGIVDIEHIIRSMNRSMPSSRRTLLDHTESGDHSYRTKDGGTITISDAELDDLGNICTEIEKMRLLLPIFVSTDTSSDNAWKVDGITETSVVSKILNRKPFREDMMRFYHPDLRMLRSRFPNAVSVLYLP